MPSSALLYTSEQKEASATSYRALEGKAALAPERDPDGKTAKRRFIGLLFVELFKCELIRFNPDTVCVH